MLIYLCTNYYRKGFKTPKDTKNRLNTKPFPQIVLIIAIIYVFVLFQSSFIIQICYIYRSGILNSKL